MERFVRAVVAGGVALVAGLWVATLLPARSLPRALGVALAAVGVVGLGYGIYVELDY